MKERIVGDVAIMPSQFDAALRVERIARLDERYQVEAYFFVLEGLEHTQKKLKRTGKSKQERHVSGQELCDGLRSLALKQFGPLARTVFQQWGVSKTRDFGEIVYILIQNDMLGKTDSDSIEDFTDVYDFDEAFGF